MVMPARVADDRVADVLCGKGAAGMQPLGVAPSTRIQTQRRFGFEKSLVRAFHPGMKNTATSAQRHPSKAFVPSMAYSTGLCDVYT